MGKKNSYIDEFVEDQQNQYTPWKYINDNKPDPTVKASGNAKLAGILHFSSGLFCVAVGIILTIVLSGTEKIGSLIAFAFGFFFLLVALGYFRKHRQRKAEIKEQIRIEKSRRKKGGRKRKRK